MNEKQSLYNNNLLPQISKTTDEICRDARTRCFQGLKGGESGAEVIKCLTQYTRVMLSHIRRMSGRHSQYFLIYHFSRLSVPVQLALGEMFNWQQEDYENFKRETLWFSWLYSRITLTALKYGNTYSKDMQTLPPRVKGTAGHSIPNQLTDMDAIDLWTVLCLMFDYEEAKYCLKRAGKGGKFIWTDQECLQYDVVLDTSVRKLVEVFDNRVNTTGNLLSFSGTWAPTESGDDFPLPKGEFTLVHPWPKQITLKSRLSFDVPIVLTLIDNIAGQGKHLGWQIPGTRELLEGPPPWLFQWLRMESLLPRLELLRGVIKKHLELFGRPSYEPEDLILALSAITRYQIKSCLETNSLWFQIFNYGYSIWTEPYELLKNRILPEFQHLRNTYIGSSSSDLDWERLLSVIGDIKWDEGKYKQINILRFSPINMISPIDENTWLIDWTLMQHLILDYSSAYGRMIGTVAILRGRELQKIIGEYLESHADSLGITIWRLGHEQGNIRFQKKKSRDVDIGIIVDDHLFVIEVKAHAAKRDLLIVGEPDSLKQRWENMIIEDIKKLDALSECLLKNPRGDNYEIPDSVKWIVPIVCGPFPEWIPLPEKKWWLYVDIPRICTPNELLETIERVKEGNFPKYRIAMSR